MATSVPTDTDRHTTDVQQGYWGPLVQPGDPDSEEASTICNAMIDKRRALGAECASAVAVITDGRDTGRRQ